MTTSPRVLVATPVYGSPLTSTVHVGYMQGVMSLATATVSFLHHRLMVNADVVRSRSRAVRIALDGAFTHLLFWDSDVVGDGVLALRGMLDANVDVIAAAYPRKSIPAKPAHQPPHVAMGFTLLSATCLDAMWDRFYDDLWFDDLIDGRTYRTVALFALLMQDRPQGRRAMLSEDYSFCERWASMGGAIHLYDGPGAPMGHIGPHTYTGTREEMGLS